MKRFALSLFFLLTSTCFAGWDTGLTTKDAGRDIQTETITVTTYTATALNSQSFDYVNVDIFNNSAYTLWIGSNTTTLAASGFPILSSKTYTMDGKYTGIVYGTFDAAAAGSFNVRTIEYLFNRPK